MEKRSICFWSGLALLLQFPNAGAEVSVLIKNASGQQLSNAGCTLQGTGLETTGSSVQMTVSDGCISTTACTPAYQVSPTSLSITRGTTANFTVKLACAPASAVNVTALSLATSVATVSPNNYSITDTTAKTFTVSGANLGTTTIDLNGSTSYASNNISDVAVSVIDVDCADPLTDQWDLPTACVPTPPGEAVSVVKGVINGNTYLPGPDRFTGSFTDDKVWSIRHRYNGTATLSRITLALAEGGETTVSYDMAISRIPGNFTQTKDASGATVNIPTVCTASNRTTATLYLNRRDLAGTSYCPLDSGQYYYVNVRVTGTPGCGIGSKQCRMMSFSNIPE